MEEFPYEFPVSNVPVHKAITWMGGDPVQIAQVAGVGQLVEIDDRSAFPLDPVQDEIRSYKACATSHQDCMFHVGRDLPHY
jgi:hypothetical protein